MAMATNPRLQVAAAVPTFPSKRPPIEQRKFVSRAVEQTITRVKARISDPELAWMFENCYPNTLDTTVEVSKTGGRVDTFIITGDIGAMWRGTHRATYGRMCRWPRMTMSYAECFED